MMDPLIQHFLPFVRPLLDAGHRIKVAAMPASAEALLLCALREETGRTVLWVSAGLESLEVMHRDILSLEPERAAGVLYYPPWDAVVNRRKRRTGAVETETSVIDPEVSGIRLAALRTLAGAEKPLIVVTCIQALMQRVPSREGLVTGTVVLRQGDEHEIEVLARSLTDAGYEFVTDVTEKAQAAQRGGLLDIWPLTETWPLRIEFMGSVVESIRSFNPADQQSIDRREEATLPPATEWALDADGHAAELVSLLSFLSEDAVQIWSDLDAITSHASLYEETINDARAGLVVPFSELMAAAEQRRGSRQVLTGEMPAEDGVHDADIAPIQTFAVPRRDIMQPDMAEQSRRTLLDGLSAAAHRGERVMAFFDTQGSYDHFSGPLAGSGIELRVGSVSAGFTAPGLGLTVVAESDLYGRRKAFGRRYDPRAGIRRPDRETGARVNDLSDIEPDDLVVHLDHGIGKYLGLFDITFNGQKQEVLTLEYDEGVKLHVPVAQAHLLSRYVGFAKHKVKLHKLGGKRWTAEKIAAQSAVQDMASSLLQTQASRTLLQGVAMPVDTPWQREFEAAFPYWETPDQHAVIAEVKSDMESPRPMDRLICGDAGFGKTEIAMRAAFKTVMSGRQVAVLVPTTVLAQQHYETFCERMAAYPVSVDVMCRFRGRSEHAGTLRGLATGGVDIVIGTHALLQPGIVFKDLGLVIVDEEQRFGVGHKEQLKRLRQMVDVLTMTATPIPRTLYMSMTGIRDLSLLQTPPRERMAIETMVSENTDRVVREAILRELNREGQVFYIHNRVMTIDKVRERLARLVPEARVAVGHGQMAAGALEHVMEQFVDGRADVLLCTTIVESGVDIPRANTILIDRADRFGIADLYQLRGRVGRSSRKAYAYLLLPPHGVIDPDARKRIAAIKQYSSLNASFKLALRDLELRGAGNLLGAAQSGHINAIGFGLYCQLLKRSICALKGEKVVPIVDVQVLLDFIRLSSDGLTEGAACIPYTYIEDEKHRVGVYRRMAEASSFQDINGIRGMLRDRFGPIPGDVVRLLKLTEVRVSAARKSITCVDVRADRLMLTRCGDYIRKGAMFPRLTAGDVDGRLDQILSLIKSCDRWSRAVPD